MPNITVEEKEKNAVKLTFTLSPEEIQPFLEDAADRLSKQSSIPGFRAGKAGYEIVKQRVGEEKILEEALESIVRKLYVKAILDHEIDSIGSPKIDVEKMAPGNDLIFTAEVTRMPRVKTLAEYKNLTVEKIIPTVSEKDIELALKDLTRMKTIEVRAEQGSVVTENDKVTLSLEMKKEGIPLEGGQSLNHIVLMTEEYYIPGFKEQLVGLKEGETKTFTLTFPTKNTQEFLAGKDVEFMIIVKEIFHLQPPELNDEFAASLGLKDLAQMNELIHKNLLDEKIHEETVRQEQQVLELVANKTQFEDIPDLLLNEEINKMIHELKHRVEEQGMEFDSYIQSLKKTLAQVKMDFTPQALLRLKIALILREIAKQESIVATDAEVDAELDIAAERYEDKDAKQKVYSPEYRQYFEQIIQNRKVIEHLKSHIVK